jgi:DNA polymerase-3 subunit epsilon
LEGVLEATHARPRLVLAPHPAKPEFDAFWLAGGRLVDWGPLPDGSDELARRTEAALDRGGRIGELGAHVAPDEVDELRIIGRWLASHPDGPRLMLQPALDRESLTAFTAGAASAQVIRSRQRADHSLGST